MIEDTTNWPRCKCGRPIHPERAEIIPTCINCTNQEIPLVLMNYEHKTAGAPIIVRNKESQRQAWNAYLRKR